MKNKNILNAIQLSKATHTKSKKPSKIRYLFSVVFLPVVLLQSPALAETEAPVLLPLNGNGKEQINLGLVNCNEAIILDCGLARLILPGSTFMKKYDLRLDNPTSSSIKIMNAVVYADGSNNHGTVQLGDQKTDGKMPPFSINIDKPIPPDKIDIIPITLNSSVMYPDQYNGAVVLTLGHKNRLSFPINLSVRSGPLLPLFVLVLGVVLGRLTKYVQERGEPQSKWLKEVYRLQSDIKTANLEDRDRELLIKMVTDVQTQVNREQLEAASVEIPAISDRLALLVKLNELEDQFNKNAQSPDLPSDADIFIVDIRNARLLIAQKENGKAKDLLEKVIANLISNVGSRSAGGAPELDGIQRSLEKAVTDTKEIGSSVLSIEPTNKFRELMVTFSGVSDQMRADATFWIVRPLFSTFLLIGLSFVGMGSLYVEKPIFGANPFADYLGLIIWGMSADVASRKLVDITGDDGK
jgi:hypothetical protein